MPLCRYVHNMPKDEAQKLIEYETEGSFIVRTSESHKGCFALAYMYNGVISQQLIEDTVSGMRIRLSASNFFAEYVVQRPDMGARTSVHCFLNYSLRRLLACWS